MKIIKWISILLVGLLTIPLLSLEAYYLYSVKQLDLDKVTSNSSYSQAVYDALWVSLGEKGEIELEPSSATRFTINFLSYAFHDITSDHSRHFSKGSIVSSHVARLLALKNKQHISNGHLSNIITAIWLSRNSDINDLIRFLIDESYYGESQYGLKSASRIYFNKNSSDLSINEIIGLIALLKAPTQYNPVYNPERFKQRTKVLYSKLTNRWPEKYPSNIFTPPQVTLHKNHQFK